MEKERPRIHLFDWVTVNDGNATDDVFMRVVGALQVDKWHDLGGMWEVMAPNTDKRHTTFGMYMTVWKPVPPPDRKRSPV